MELFGYLCSPFCKTKAEALKIDVPVYAGQKTVVEAKYWKKVGKIFAAAGGVTAALFGFWFWYAWFGSVPHPVFSVRFDDPAYTGEGRFCGKDQIVFLHGPTLARYDIKAKKKILVAGVVHPAAGFRRYHPHGEIYRRSWPPGGPRRSETDGGNEIGDGISTAGFRIERLGCHAGETDALRLEHRAGVE